MSTSEKDPKVKIITEFGDITIQLYARFAPLTVTNFLDYIDRNLFDNSTFFRILNAENQPGKFDKIQVIQGGLKADDEKNLTPVVHETTKLTGITHRDGTVSMARTHPGSATGSFFICIGDQPALDCGGSRQPDGCGFAAFGKVTQGMDVVRRIWQHAEQQEYLQNEIPIHRVARLQGREALR